MGERRKTVRFRNYLGGQIAFDNRCSGMECTIRNLSAGGARVTFSDAAVLPRDFNLAIRQKGLHARARVVWRSPTEMGLCFLAVSRHSDEKAGPSDLARRVRRLEAEKAALKQRVAQLSTGDYVP